MSRPNEQLLQRYFAVFRDGDLDTVAACYTEDVVFHEPGRHPLAGAHKGPDGVLDFMLRLVERTEGSLSVEEVVTVVADAETGVARLHVMARSTDGPMEFDVVELFSFRDSRISEIRAYLHQQYEWDSVLT